MLNSVRILKFSSSEEVPVASKTIFPSSSSSIIVLEIVPNSVSTLVLSVPNGLSPSLIKPKEFAVLPKDSVGRVIPTFLTKETSEFVWAFTNELPVGSDTCSVGKSIGYLLYGCMLPDFPDLSDKTNPPSSFMSAS